MLFSCAVKAIQFVAEKHLLQVKDVEFSQMTMFVFMGF